MKYPNISVLARAGNDFSVEVRHDDDGDWETYFNGNDREMGIKVLNECLRKWVDYPLYISNTEVDIKGYLFQIREKDSVRKFFKPVDKVRNPFYNRKMYAQINPEASVSFVGMNLD